MWKFLFFEKISNKKKKFRFFGKFCYVMVDIQLMMNSGDYFFFVDKNNLRGKIYKNKVLWKKNKTCVIEA